MTQTKSASAELRKKELREYFSKQSGLEVHDNAVQGRWPLRHGFYFDKAGNWQYILDISLDEMERELKDIIGDLETAKWLEVLQSHAGQSVPFFTQGKFAAPTEFRKWKPKFKHLKRPVNASN